MRRITSGFKSYLSIAPIIFFAALFIGVSIKSYFLPWAQYSFVSAIFPLVISVNADEASDFGGDGKRIAAYRRVSATKQVNQGFSLEVQKETLEKMVGLNKPSMVYWFSDAGKTGTTLTNRKISDIIQLAKDGKIDELWVCYIDRLGRNTHDLLDLYNRLTELNVSIRTPDYFYSPDDLSSLLLVMIKFHNAEDDNKQRIKRVIDSKRRRFREKRWNKGGIHLGYMADGDWLKKMHEWEPLIKDAFRLFNERCNFCEVTRILNEMYFGILKKPLETYHLKTILSDPLYIGKPSHLGEVVEDKSLSFVEVDVFEEVSKKLQKIKEDYERHEIGPLEKVILEEGCDSEVFKEIWFHCVKCGSWLVKNGTIYIHGVKQQILLCQKCNRQWKIPRIAKGSEREVNPLNHIRIKMVNKKKTSFKIDKKSSSHKEDKFKGNLDRFFKV